MLQQRINTSLKVFFKGPTLHKMGQSRGLIFLQVDQVPKYFGASATVSPPKTGPKGRNTRTLITFSDDLLLLL